MFCYIKYVILLEYSISYNIDHAQVSYSTASALQPAYRLGLHLVCGVQARPVHSLLVQSGPLQ
jgi:hypothetical protein